MKITYFILLLYIISISSSGIYEVFKEEKKIDDFENEIKKSIYVIHIKNTALCINKTFKEIDDRHFLHQLRTFANGNYYKQKAYLLNKYERYKKCIRNNTSYQKSPLIKREYYY